MARNKCDVDERLESPFQWKHLKRAGKYIGRHKYKMLLALGLSQKQAVLVLYGVSAIGGLIGLWIPSSTPLVRVLCMIAILLALLGILDVMHEELLALFGLELLTLNFYNCVHCFYCFYRGFSAGRRTFVHT